MTNPRKRNQWLAVALTVLAASWSALGLGCGQNAASQEKEPVAPPVQVTTTPAPSPATTASFVMPQLSGDQLHQSWKAATIDEAPEDQKLPDRTRAGVSVGKIYEAVVGNEGVGGLWEQVKFVTPTGKQLAYTATIKTDLGNVTLELWPHVAPNHVRNFVALARAGYYNGLVFDRTMYELIEGEKDQFFECVLGGCPEGTGEAGLGSIGYWMKPELSERVKHEPGTLGAWHEEDVETAACKFYITLSNAPFMDGEYTVFGRVTEGLDKLNTIRNRPVYQDVFKDRPEQPVVIRAVTIDCREMDAGQPR